MFIFSAFIVTVIEVSVFFVRFITSTLLQCKPCHCTQPAIERSKTFPGTVSNELPKDKGSDLSGAHVRALDDCPQVTRMIKQHEQQQQHEGTQVNKQPQPLSAQSDEAHSLDTLPLSPVLSPVLPPVLSPVPSPVLKGSDKQKVSEAEASDESAQRNNTVSTLMGSACGEGEKTIAWPELTGKTCNNGNDKDPETKTQKTQPNGSEILVKSDKAEPLQLSRCKTMPVPSLPPCLQSAHNNVKSRQLKINSRKSHLRKVKSAT